MAKNNKTIKIEIDKNKLIKAIVVIFVVFCVCLVCFLVSKSKGVKYTDSSSISDSNDNTEILAEITKQAGNISDEERTQPKEISLSDYLNLYSTDTNSLILISRPTCQYCKIATPILENIIYESNVQINYLNADNLSEEDNNTLLASDEYFNNGYGTPLLLVVGSNSIKDKIEGLVTKESYQEFFKQYGFME